MTQLTQAEKKETNTKIIRIMDMVSKTNGFDWITLPQNVQIAMIDMFIQGIKYTKKIMEKNNEHTN